MLGFVLIGAQDCWDQEPALKQRQWKPVASRWRQSSRARIRPPSFCFEGFAQLFGRWGRAEKSKGCTRSHPLTRFGFCSSYNSSCQTPGEGPRERTPVT